MKQLLRNAFDAAVDFPPLDSAVFPDDKIAVVPDGYIVRHGKILAALLEHLVDLGMKPEDITVLLSESELAAETKKPRLRPMLPAEIRENIVFYGFTPQKENSCAILGLTPDGDPVAMARPLVDADVILPIERHYPAPPFGHFGLLSVLTPRFADLTTQIHFQAADGVKGREKIIETLSVEIEDRADRLGVLMVIEAIVDDAGEIVELVYGKPSSVRKKLSGTQSGKAPSTNDQSYSVQSNNAQSNKGQSNGATSK